VTTAQIHATKSSKQPKYEIGCKVPPGTKWRQFATSLPCIDTPAADSVTNGNCKVSSEQDNIGKNALNNNAATHSIQKPRFVHRKVAITNEHDLQDASQKNYKFALQFESSICISLTFNISQSEDTNSGQTV